MGKVRDYDESMLYGQSKAKARVSLKKDRNFPSWVPITTTGCSVTTGVTAVSVVRGGNNFQYFRSAGFSFRSDIRRVRWSSLPAAPFTRHSAVQYVPGRFSATSFFLHYVIEFRDHVTGSAILLDFGIFVGSLLVMLRSLDSTTHYFIRRATLHISILYTSVLQLLQLPKRLSPSLRDVWLCVCVRMYL